MLFLNQKQLKTSLLGGQTLSAILHATEQLGEEEIIAKLNDLVSIQAQILRKDHLNLEELQQKQIKSK